LIEDSKEELLHRVVTIMRTNPRGKTSMISYRCVAIVIIILLSAHYSSAFRIPIHVSITENAIGELAFTWTPPVDLKGQWFLDSPAIREIVNANISRDTGDCSNTKEGGSEDNVPAVPCGATDIYAGNVGKLYDDNFFNTQALAGAIEAFYNIPEDHFDDELFKEANDQLIGARSAVLSYLRSGNYIGARKQLGYALHTLQDFYAHTNWVELGNTSYVSRLGYSDAFARITLAGEHDPTCSDGNILLTDYPPAEFINSLNLLDQLGADTSAVRRSLAQRPLTSGFFPNTHPRIAADKKCAHGLPFPLTRGLNKDDDEEQNVLRSQSQEEQAIRLGRHQEAARIATTHSRIFIRDLLTEGCGQNTNCYLGFMGVIEGNTPSSDNPVSAIFFTIDPTAHTCPAPPAGHVHASGWVDVNAKAWNYSGFTVKKGETYRIETKPGGLIMWRDGFLGKYVTPPEGDASANPGNTLFWVTPPIPGAPIGMLIGGIWPEKGNLPPELGAQSSSIFRVGAARTVTMDAGGWLFLSVNDGYLSENAGCFQARITRVR
jgi:hypothetical protein